jgi:hypothetical protein
LNLSSTQNREEPKVSLWLWLSSEMSSRMTTSPFSFMTVIVIFFIAGPLSPRRRMEIRLNRATEFFGNST